MATAPTLDLVPQTSTDIVATVTTNPGIVLLDREKFDAWYEKLSAEAPTDVDISTNKGRDALRSFAAKVRSEKAAIDKARLRLTEEWRTMTSQANAAGKEISTRLETLAIEVRRPLTEWEDAEKARETECRAVIEGMRAAKIIAEDDTSETVRTRGTEVFSTALDPERFGDMLGEAQTVKADAIDTLKRALARLLQEEANREELAKLRAEREEAERVAAEKLAAEQAIEGRRQYARDIIEHIHQCGLGMIGGKPYPYVILIRELEDKIDVTKEDFGDMADDVEKARVETLARIKEAAAAQAERAQREAAEAAAQEAREAEARKAEDAQAQRDREHAEELAAERRRADEAERLAQEERDRLAREKAETARRATDQQHRAEVKRAAKEAIMSCGADEETARKIVMAVLANEIPNMKLEF